MKTRKQILIIYLWIIPIWLAAQEVMIIDYQYGKSAFEQVENLIAHEQLHDAILISDQSFDPTKLPAGVDFIPVRSSHHPDDAWLYAHLGKMEEYLAMEINEYDPLQLYLEFMAVGRSGQKLLIDSIAQQFFWREGDRYEQFEDAVRIVAAELKYAACDLKEKQVTRPLVVLVKRASFPLAQNYFAKLRAAGGMSALRSSTSDYSVLVQDEILRVIITSLELRGEVIMEKKTH